jgi:hypothetical protein
MFHMHALTTSNMVVAQCGWTAFHYTVFSLLLESTANCATHQLRESKPLFRWFELLLEQGADLGARSNQTRSPTVMGAVATFGSSVLIPAATTAYDLAWNVALVTDAASVDLPASAQAHVLESATHTQTQLSELARLMLAMMLTRGGTQLCSRCVDTRSCAVCPLAPRADCHTHTCMYLLTCPLLWGRIAGGRN